MKKIIILLFVFASAHLGYSQKYTLQLELVAGETYTQNSQSQSTILQSMQGQNMEIKMDVKGKISFKVLSVEKDLYTLEAKYQSMSMTMAMPQGSMDFSSDKKDSDPASAVMGAMVDKPFQMKMSKTGKITEVTGVEELFASATMALGQLDEMQKKQILEQIVQSYGGNAFKANMEISTAIFPDQKVGKGDSWKVNTKLESGAMNADVETTFSLTDVIDGTYVISGKSIMKPINSDTCTQMAGMEMKYNMTAGSMTSTLKLDKTTGWVKEGDSTQEMDIDLVLKDSPQVPGGMTIPMQIDTKMKITN